MIFQVYTARDSYSKKRAEELAKLCNVAICPSSVEDYRKAGHWSLAGRGTVAFNSLEELIAWQARVGQSIILELGAEDELPAIWIYDDYIE